MTLAGRVTGASGPGMLWWRVSPAAVSKGTRWVVGAVTG